jgi:tetratricopeptide (TPR) repeat protein
MKKVLIAGILLVLTIAGCQQKDEQKPQYEFPSAPGGSVQMMEREKLLKGIVAKEPGNVNAWVSLGDLLMDSSRFEEAIGAYRKALELDPKNTDARVDMGTCYRNIGKPDIAVQEYRKALEYDPRHLFALKNMGIVYAYDLRDNEQAVKAFEKALEIAPNAPDAERLKQEIQKLKAGQ